jgi:hypothetical protein
MAKPATTPAETKAPKLTHKSDLKAGATPDEVQAHKNKAMGEARSFAQSQLIQAHRTEFNELVKAQAKARGYDWSPAPTAEEKALAEAEALLEKFPHLREKLTGTPSA